VLFRSAFPDYRATEYLAGDFILSLPHDILDAIRQNGIRNSHLTAIAPAGSISLLANNVSSGIEPIYACQAKRRVRARDGSIKTMPVNDYAWSMYRRLHGDSASLPDFFVEAADVDPLQQLQLQARLQAHVDQSISKTINLPTDASFDSVCNLFTQAHRLGLKGCTMFRAAAASEAVLCRADSAPENACP